MITEEDNIRGREATMKRSEGAFAQRRKWIQALRDFEPGMAVEDEDVPISTLILAFLCFIGMVTSLLVISRVVLWLTL